MNIEKSDIKLNNKKEILEKKEFELNSLNYKNAIKYDHRDYWNE